MPFYTSASYMPHSGTAHIRQKPVIDPQRQAEFDRGLREDQRQFDQADSTARRGQSLQAQASMFPHQLRQQRFDQVWPWAQQQFGGFNQLFGQSGGGQQVGTQPQIESNPIWGEQAIQQQVNARRSANDQGTAAQIRGMREDLGGRGFGSNSPLAQALATQYQMQNLATNTANERDFRFDAAQQNAQHVLRAQQALEEQYANRQMEDIQRQRNFISGLGTQASLLGALAGFI